MQLVEGNPLSQSIPKGGMPLERIFDTSVPLADALATATQDGRNGWDQIDTSHATQRGPASFFC